MSKNRLRGITLVRGPIWGIHSLTLIISCSEPLIECQSILKKMMYFAEFHASQWLSCRFLNTPVLTFECNHLTVGELNMTFVPYFKSKYRGNQMEEDTSTLLLIIWSQALAYCFRFWQVGVVIIMILRASVLSADEKPENKFYTRFCTDISSFERSEF